MINSIRAVRRAKGLTLEEVGARCDPPTTAQTIGRLETGTRTLSLGWMNRIAKALGVDAADGSKLTVNVPSSGRIAGGATVERAVDTGFATSDWLTFNLHQFDATNAKRVADAINAAIPGSASMIDGASIAIRAAGNGDDRMRLMSQIENLGVTRSEPPAKVIVNARTGTVVINGAVRVGTAAVGALAEKPELFVFLGDNIYGDTRDMDVLRGKSTDKTRQHGHERLSTFGIGADVSEAQWRGVLRQLIAS